MRLFHSLKFRILSSALVMVVLMLPMIGFTISNAYEKHMTSSIKSELTAYSYSILALAEVNDGQLYMPEQLLENRFNVGQSGLYALFSSTSAKHSSQTDTAKSFETKTEKVLWRTPSFLGFADPKLLPEPEMGAFEFAEHNLNDELHFILSLAVSFSDESLENTRASTPLVLHVLYEKLGFENQLNEFKERLWLVLAIFTAAILLFQFVWLNWTLKPLSTLTRQIAAVEKGKLERLDDEYPDELQRVTEQLNRLLATEQHQRTRYRNALSDLAHSLKTPLAVIQSQPALSELTHSQLNSINKMVEHQLKRAQSAGQSAWHLGIEILPVANKLIASLEKIYREKSISYSVKIDEDAVFNGEEADLLELLGNLLDNAAKAAKTRVSISVMCDAQQVCMRIEDDGQGIPQAKIESIFNRGTRADTYDSGHGIGLAIVRDLVESYQGTIEIDRSEVYGGACFMICFEKK